MKPVVKFVRETLVRCIYSSDWAETGMCVSTVGFQL